MRQKQSVRGNYLIKYSVEIELYEFFRRSRTAARLPKEQTMKNLFETVFTWFNNTENRELEAYLSKAANPADVDRLLREWENNQDKSFFYLP